MSQLPVQRSSDEINKIAEELRAKRTPEQEKALQDEVDALWGVPAAAAETTELTRRQKITQRLAKKIVDENAQVLPLAPRHDVTPAEDMEALDRLLDNDDEDEAA